MARRGIEISSTSDGSVAALDSQPGCRCAIAVRGIAHETDSGSRRGRGPKLPGILEEAIAAFKAKPEKLEVIVATMVPAINGADGCIHWMPAFDPDAQGKRRHNGRRSSEDRSLQPIALHHRDRRPTDRHGGPAHGGTDGYDVNNKPLKAKPGAGMNLKTDETVAIDEQGRVMATVNGVVKFANNALKVMPLFEVPEIR